MIIIAILFIVLYGLVFLSASLMAITKPSRVKIKKLHPDAIIPKYAHSTDAGMDLYAIEDYDLIPGIPVLVKTGIAIELPNGTEAQVRPRSGLALNEVITVLNTPGTIDQDYRGEIGVIMISLDNRKIITTEIPVPHYKAYHISKGDKIAQLVINKLPKVIIKETKSLSDTARGENGFGSTGKK